MALNDELIKALLEGCGGVTPGPWTVEMHGPSPVLYSGRSNERHGLNLLRLSDGDWNFNNNVVHIARCDPQTIRELCTRVLLSEALVESYRVGAISDKEIIDELKEECDALQARVKLLESVIAQYPNEEHAAVLEAGK